MPYFYPLGTETRNYTIRIRLSCARTEAGRDWSGECLSHFSIKMGLAPMLTVAPFSGVTFPFRSCQSVYPGDTVNDVEPHAALLQGKVVAVLSHTKSPL